MTEIIDLMNKLLPSCPNSTVRPILGKAQNAQQIPFYGMMLDVDLGFNHKVTADTFSHQVTQKRHMGHLLFLLN